MSSMPFVVQKKSSASVNVEFDQNLVEQFKKAISVSNRDLGQKVESIEESVGEIIQALDKHSKMMKTILSKLDDQACQLESLESQQLKMKVHLQQQASEGDIINYEPFYQTREDKDKARRQTRDNSYEDRAGCRGGKQPEHAPSRDQRNPDPIYQRPQHKMRYRSEHDTRTESEHDADSPHKNISGFHHFHDNKTLEPGHRNDNMFAGGQASTTPFRPELFGKKQQTSNNYSQDYGGDKRTEKKGFFQQSKGRMCKCMRGVQGQGSRDPNVVDCTHAELKNYGPLDTAYLMIQMEDDPTFKAEVVKLDKNNIHYLQKGLIMPGHESSILSLDFSFNKIGTLDRKSFDNFPKLVKLKLTHNRLRYYEISDDWLTDRLGKSLHQLYLDYNFIEKLDDGIFDKLTNLSKLVLDGNNGLQLTAQTFGPGLKKLRTLSLDNCGLDKLDVDMFKNLVSLSQLSLSGNKFTTIPAAIATIPKLSILAMSENPLVKLVSLSFKEKSESRPNKVLKTIYLRKMPELQEVQSCAFCDLTGLETVDLSGSKKLTKLDVGAFGIGQKHNLGANRVKSLLLSDCALTAVDENLLDWTDEHKLALNGNPLLCDCENMQWLMRNKAKIQFQKETPTCAAPNNFKGMTLKEANNQGCGAIASSSSQKMTLIVVLVGLCASIFVVGFFYAHSKGGVRNFLPVGRPASPPLGYSNLNARANPVHTSDHSDGMDDGDRLEDDFNRPEFV